MENKKIILITPSLAGGGAEKMLLFVAHALAEVFTDVTVASFANDKQINNENYKVIFLNDDRHSKLKSRIDKVKKIRAVIIQGHYDCLITFGVSYALWCRLAAIHLPIVMIASERRSPMNLKLHWKILSKLVYRSYDGMVYQLEKVRKFYRTNHKLAMVIHNPFLVRQDSPALPAKDRESVIISAAARLDEPEKGMDVLIKSFTLLSNDFPELELHLYGNDPQGNVAKLVPEGLRQQIKIYPKSDHIVQIINQKRIFVLPSRVEGIPNMLLETMGAGNPVIAADCPPGGPRLLTDNGRDGMLFKNGDVDDLARQLRILLNDGDYADQLIRRSQNVVSRFDEDKIGLQWQTFVSAILKQGRSGFEK